MNRRRGVMILFFDLPTGTKEQRKAYTDFRKGLKRAGYLPMQESVYVKLLRSSAMLEAEAERLKELVPKEGKVFVLPMGLGDFLKMKPLLGKGFDKDFFSNDTVFVISH